MNHKLPGDRGLASLGLVMQLGGAVSLALMALFAVVYMLGFREHEGFGAMMLVLALALIRSMAHHQAGTDLFYGRGFAAGKRYVIAAAVQTVITMFALASLHATGGVILALGTALALWPTILAAIYVRGHFDGATVAEDRGYEAVSIVMTILGAAGAFASIVVVVVVFRRQDNFASGAGGLFLLVAAMLLVRSLVHVQAGLAGLRGDPRTHQLAQRYASFGVITSFCAAGALFLLSLTEGIDLLAMLVIIAFAMLLVQWPLIVRRFFTERKLTEIAEDAQATRAPDAGLTALGWFLVGHASVVMITTLPQLTGGMSLAGLDVLFATPKPWLLVTVGVLELGAGLALVHMVSLHRVIAVAYGAIAAIATAYLYWPLLRQLGRDDDVLLALPLMALQLVLPIATMGLVRREVAPTARARYRAPRAPDTISR